MAAANGDEGPGPKVHTAKNKKSTTTKSLESLLKSPSEPVWEKGLATVTPELLNDDAVVDTLCKFVNRESEADRFTPSLVRAMSFLAEAKQPKAGEQLATLFGSSDDCIVMAVADIVSVTQDRGFLEPLMKLADRRDFSQRYGFRRCVMDAIARYPDKKALDFLIERLGRFDGQLKYEMAMSLHRSTGQNFGGKAADWQNWWKDKRESFVFSSRVESPRTGALKEPPKAIPWDEPRPSFYGMTIYAKRVVFVVDRSGSMNAEVDGMSRLARAQLELQRAINALSETDSFNVVSFDDRMEVFQPRLVNANEANKNEGIRFAFGLEPRGGTACYEPLKMALEASNDLELILFVSDGEPTAGALVDPSAIVVAISNHNLTQRTTINTLGIDARDSHEKFLKNLAEKNLGKLLLIR